MKATTSRTDGLKDFHNKIVYITGGSSGIGLEIARLMVSKGAHVALFARNPEKLERARNEIMNAKHDPSQKITAIPVDITDMKNVSRNMDEAVKQFGKPDILINCAGIVKADYFENISYEDFDAVMKTNVYGARNMIAALLPSMKGKGGHIVNVSSAAGLMSMFSYTAYGTSKFALVGFSDCLRSEMKLHNINVSVVCPPEVKTPMNQEEAKTMPPEALAVKGLAGVLKPENVAKTVVKGILKKKFLIIPGFKCRFLYITQKLSPGWLSRAISDSAIRSAVRKMSRTG
ncbi:MAG: SDR family oxidoreductase [Deltaproteobacteria bacterium]|nr:SDR family oxidoreductase [Deltaproteobacteria bacterium]